MAGANIPRYEFVESARVKNNKCKNKLTTAPGFICSSCVVNFPLSYYHIYKVLNLKIYSF